MSQNELRADEIAAQLHRILESPIFRTSDRLRRFLRFVVESSLSGREPAKEYQIATSVYDRPASYDPRVDPIVRVEASRLRAKLREYYETVGAGDPFQIVIPKGRYAPEFRGRAATDAPPPPRVEPTVVLVLPFADLSGGAQEGYFVDGLTEELITTLARVPGLRVVGRTTAFRLRSAAEDVTVLAQRLGVHAILDGTVRRGEGRLRVTAQLVDASDACSMWSRAYERREGDLLDLQQELALSIAAALRVELTAGAHPASRHFDVTAHELFLKGRQQYHAWTLDGARASIRWFEDAIARAPDYAPPHFGLADSLCFLAYQGVATAANVARTKHEIDHVLRLDSTYGEAYIPLGVLRAFYEWDRRGAERAFQAALALCPGLADVHHFHAISCLTPSGRTKEGVASMEVAAALDPLSSRVGIDLGRVLYLDRQFDRALRQLAAASERDPAFREAHWQTGIVLGLMGRAAEALAAFDRALALEPARGGTAGTLGYVHAAAGNRDEARAWLARAATPSEEALVYAGLGEVDPAMDALERAANERARDVLWLKVDPRFDALRESPRFAALLARVHPG